MANNDELPAASTITLKRPVTHAGKTITEIVVDEPTAGAIEAAEKVMKAGGGEMAAMMAILSADNELPIEAVRKIRSSDMQAIAQAYGPFAGTVAAGGTGAP